MSVSAGATFHHPAHFPTATFTNFFARRFSVFPFFAPLYIVGEQFSPPKRVRTIQEASEPMRVTLSLTIKAQSALDSCSGSLLPLGERVCDQSPPWLQAFRLQRPSREQSLRGSSSRPAWSESPGASWEKALRKPTRTSSPSSSNRPLDSSGTRAVCLLYAYVERKQIPHFRMMGRAIRFSISELEKWRQFFVNGGIDVQG